MNKIDFIYGRINEAMSNHAEAVHGEVNDHSAAFIKYNIFFAFDIDELEKKYIEYYLPAAKAYSLSLVDEYESASLKESIDLPRGFFEDPVQECLRNAYVLIYHKIESLVKHMFAFSEGSHFGIFKGYAVNLKSSFQELNEVYGLKKDLLYKSASQRSVANSLVDRLRMIANCCKHDDGYLQTNDEAMHKLVKSVDENNRIILDEDVLRYDIRFLKAYAQVVFTLIASVMLKSVLESSIKNNTDNDYAHWFGEEAKIELESLRADEFEVRQNISLIVDAIKTDNEAVFWQKLKDLDIVKVVPIQDLTLEQEKQVVWKRYD
ncbi:hypothetical protein [Hymenobacter guriensis]|uniref:Uncharacterized protein n=1 Tax=Hymenobacter guriensis TaxID=2793065 RepID=A0ABS0L7B5_9BACT|nr:hypothetical protein [Hymenobacter guriensis]MBG8555979.1 hypothetical protein [Hymenobacter guriensis]